MAGAEDFVRELERAGFGIVSGVPCSYLTPLINTTLRSQRVRYVGAANEGDAVAVACGAQLGGVGGVAMFQNSGLGNAVSPLTSLTATFRIPILVISTWRGQPGRAADEPQHELMGAVTPGLFELMDIPWEPFPESDAAIPDALARARQHMKARGTPYALIVSKGAVEGSATAPAIGERPLPAAEPPPAAASARLDPDAALRAIHDSVAGRDVVLATTGFTGRALYGIGDGENQLYMVGSMGCVSSLGLGLARARPDRRIVVIDGDGAMLMRMGAVATVGYERPRNLLHVLLDNGVHDSTGSQGTVAPFVDLAAVARACGYPRVLRPGSVEALRHAVTGSAGELTFLHVRTLPRSDRTLPRPTIGPHEVAERLRRWLRKGP